MASAFVNKFLTWYRDLEKIPGEGYSTSHVIWLLLKNITDPDYQTTVAFLRNTNADLNECITAVRKHERDLMQKRVERRKYCQHIRRMVQERNNDSMESEDDESATANYLRKRKFFHNRPRRLEGTIETTRNGFLSFERGDFRKLTDDEKTFVQEWNAKVKHNEPTDKLKIPDGVNIISSTKVRRTKSEDKTIDEPSDQPKPKKKITFNLHDQEEDKEDEDDV